MWSFPLKNCGDGYNSKRMQRKFQFEPDYANSNSRLDYRKSLSKQRKIHRKARKEKYLSDKRSNYNANKSKAGMKSAGTPQRSDCGALLIASSAATNFSDLMNMDVIPRTKCDKTNRGDLIGTVADVTHFQSVLVRSGGIDVVKTFCETPNRATKGEVMKAIKDLFDQNYKSFILYYSGHGRRNKGDWFFISEKGKYEYIELNDVLKLFLHRKQRNELQKLIIIADCCYSGAWVKKLENMEGRVKNVWMQASCEENKMCSDGKYGGVFTTKYLDKSLMLSPKETCTSWTLIPKQIVSCVIGGLAMLIKDAVIMNLYERATKDFEPVLYSSDGYKAVIVGNHTFDQSVNVCVRLYSGWMSMNKRSTAQMIAGWTAGRETI